MTGRHLALVGPTATGKTAASIEVALRLGDVEIVSADALMVYRGADIGPAKPTPDERRGVPHHCLDLLDPSEEATLAGWLDAARRAVAAIEARGRRALLVGGTGLYVQALVDGFTLPGSYPEVRAALEASDEPAPALHARLSELDPLAASRIDPNNRRRVVRALEVCLGAGRPFSSFGPGLEAYPPDVRWSLAGLWPDPPWLRQRIADRAAAQLGAGLVDELRRLLDAPGGLSRTCRQALGYKELLPHVEQGAELAPCVELFVGNVRRFARRQRAWFRRDPRIHWIEGGPDLDRQISALVARWACETS